MKTFLKYASVVPLCFVTWWCTSSLMAQQRKKPASQPQTVQAEATITTVGGFVENVPGVVKPQPAVIAKNTNNLISTANFKSCEISVADGMASVNAQVSLWDRLGKESYLWRLSFLDAQENINDQLVYDTQIFGMEADGAMEPTFREVVPLPPGTSMVQLTLFSFRPGFVDLSIFKDQRAS